MKPIIKRVAMVAVIIALFAVVVVHMPAFSAEYDTEDKVTTFLSSVVGLDMAKYTLIQPSLPPSYTGDKMPNISFPSMLGGLVEQEAPSYKFEANGSTLDILSIFYNGHLEFIKVYPWGGNHIYSEPKATSVLDQTKNIIQRYQRYIPEVYAADNAYLTPMQNILNNISDLSSTNVTVGNVNFQVSTDKDNTRIQWIYMEDGVSMKWKRVDLSFRNNSFVSFRDTWGLYEVSGLSVISSKEAVKIALDATRGFELRVSHDDGEVELVKVPDLSGADYDVSFAMVPYRYQESHVPSKLSRDPLTLYPFWQIHFYFNESIAGNVGMQVGVWGDTGEIVYCSGFGYLGISSTPNEEDVIELQSMDQKFEAQKQTNILDSSTIAVAISIATVLATSTAAIAVQRRKQHKQNI